MIENESDLLEYIEKKANEIIDSGFIDIASVNDYTLPKVVLYCAMKNVAEHYRPIQKDVIKKYKNLIEYYS